MISPTPVKAQRVVAVVFVLLVAVQLVSSSAMMVPQPKNFVCPRNMPCKWAVCPWSRYLRVNADRDNSCMHIDNEACRCPDNTECGLTQQMLPIIASGTSFLKYEYKCNENRPDAMDRYYGEGRK